ncbi:hypothetical protein GGX14DRAFT_387927 [Mycena pura]|uniref:Uncharacterized protein n=1 Tax=Mycena pura TaxID=153505 RepID=A0AAD6YIA0_9AGAR|nr:hypothetical protein GGX14DRAFT_387927 [Mycena pura]
MPLGVHCSNYWNRALVLRPQWRTTTHFRRQLSTTRNLEHPAGCRCSGTYIRHGTSAARRLAAACTTSAATRNVDEYESVLLFAAVVVHPSLGATDVLVTPPLAVRYETGRSRCLHEVKLSNGARTSSPSRRLIFCAAAHEAWSNSMLTDAGTIMYTFGVCPVALRSYLATFVNICWGLGQVIDIRFIKSCWRARGGWCAAEAWMRCAPLEMMPAKDKVRGEARAARRAGTTSTKRWI